MRYNIDQITDEDNYQDIITRDFLRMESFLEWHQYAFDYSLVEFVVDEDNEIKPAEACDWIHTCRMELSQGIDQIIQYHLDMENYEIIPKIKEHVAKLRVEALRIEMNVEKFM